MCVGRRTNRAQQKKAFTRIIVMNKQMAGGLKLVAVASLTAFLAACGGGGGSSSSTTPPPQQPASAPAQTAGGVALVTSVAAPTYAAGSFQATAFKLVNDYRSAMGVGLLSQDPLLDTSAQAHALYLFSNLKSGAIKGLDHNEIAGNASYYGDTPLSRAQKAGVPTTEYVGENIAAGAQTTDAAAAADCIGQALASVYHLADLTTNQQTVGFGYTPSDATYPFYTCASEFGTTAGVVGSPGPNTYSYAGGQTLPTDAAVISPYANEVGVALAMRPEIENPAPDLAQPGRPILVRVNAQNANTLTVSQFTLTDGTGAAVAARILVPASAQAGSTASTTADPQKLLANGVAVLLPLAPLKPNTTYTVTFNGARDGVALPTKTSSFTTGAN
jgi:uncharacterized protein YkwD